MENNILLDNNAQFILLVGVVTSLLTLALLTNRLVDLTHKYRVKTNPNALAKIKRHIEHLSTITVIQLGVAGLILVRILLSPWCTNLFWFDWAIIAILLLMSIYWTWVHTLYFKDKYYFKKWYFWKKA